MYLNSFIVKENETKRDLQGAVLYLLISLKNNASKSLAVHSKKLIKGYHNPNNLNKLLLFYGAKRCQQIKVKHLNIFKVISVL